MTDAHNEFLQDPETHAAHLDECAECRALIARLNAVISHEPIRVTNLPLAGWEGATYRSWGFVAACAIVLLLTTVVLCRAAGVSPLSALSMDASVARWRGVLFEISSALRHAALVWQILFGCAVVAVNAILVLLLRRPTRGIDA
jgi:hypothetical protein